MSNTSGSVMIVKEVADYLPVNQRTVTGYCLAVDGRIPGSNVGANWRFNRGGDIDEWIAAQSAPLGGAPTRLSHSVVIFDCLR